MGKRDPNGDNKLSYLEKLYQVLDTGHRWKIMTTNGSESLNNVFKLSQRLPVTAMVENTLYKMNA